MEERFNFKKTDFLKLNLQLFAEGEPGADDKGGGQEPPKNKYSDEDYEKLKALFDKEVSEKANLKKQLKDKQTEDERKAEDEKEKNAETERMKQELATLKIERKLVQNFTEDEIKVLSPLIISGDTDKLVEQLVKLREDYKKRVLDEAKKEFSKSADLPGGSGDDDNVPSEVQSYIDKKKKTSSNKSRDYYFGAKN